MFFTRDPKILLNWKMGGVGHSRSMRLNETMTSLGLWKSRGQECRVMAGWQQTRKQGNLGMERAYLNLNIDIIIVVPLKYGIVWPCEDWKRFKNEQNTGVLNALVFQTGSSPPPSMSSSTTSTATSVAAVTRSPKATTPTLEAVSLSKQSHWEKPWFETPPSTTGTWTKACLSTWLGFWASILRTSMTV